MRPSTTGGSNRALPPEGAFVLQLRADLDVGGGAVAGRVEHVVSGRAARFESVGELLAFIARALDRSSDAGSGNRQPPGGGQGEPR